MKKQLLISNAIYWVSVSLSVSVLSVTGCGNKEQPATPPPVAVQTPPVKPNVAVQKNVSSAQKQATASSAGSQFDFSNKKDPFKPDIAVKLSSAPQAGDSKKINISGLPIHSFDVSQFRLIGIVTGSKENQAMVVDPNGKGYVIKAGMTIGKNDGRVITINSSGVDIVEQFRDDNGRLRKENIRLTLPKKQ